MSQGAAQEPPIPITLEELEEVSRKNARGEYRPDLDGLERIVHAARLAHFYKDKLDSARQHHEATARITYNEN